MWLTMALNNWKLIVIASTIFALLLSIAHGRVLSAKLETKTAEIQSMREAAKTFRSQSATIAKEINDGIPILVEQARKTAYANYQKKYGVNAACGVGAIRLPAQHGLGKADSASVADETAADPVADFAGQCAETTVMVTQWQQWARLNQLPAE